MKSLQIRILTGEITVPKSARYSVFYTNSKSYRHADGTSNTNNQGWNSEEEFENSQYLDEDTDTADLIFPAATVYPDTINNINQYYEIFNKEVYSTSSLSSGFDDKKYILSINKEYFDVNSDTFKNLDKKFWPFKRLVWYFTRTQWIIGGMPAGFAEEHMGLAIIIGEPFSSSVISHELGHLFGLGHWGDTRDPLEFINKKISYYSANSNWSPIMGTTIEMQNINVQWSNGNYLPKWPAFQDDIKTISKHGDLIKPPIINTNSVYFNNVRDLKNAKKMARVLNKNSETAIGMIGFPYDYDIVKVIVPKGSSILRIQPVDMGSKMPDFDCDILYCDCELDKDKDKTNMNGDFDTYWAPSNEVNILRKVVINNDDTYVARSLHNDFNKAIEFTLNFEYTSLIYLRIRGDFIDPVDRNEQPVENDKGQDRYGSLGKYKISITSDSAAFNNDIPNAHCEEFQVCINNTNQIVSLFVQDEKDEQIDGTEGGIHIFEGEAIINGEVKKKRFLVMGFPLNIGDPGIEGRLYFPVIVDGECKKYAFVVGIPRP